MKINATQAAKVLEQSNPDPHKLISLLMAGTLERVAQAKKSVENDDTEEKYLLVEKIIAIINGLRGSLDFDRGGEIAVNLDALYLYMLERISSANSKDEEKEVLDEVAQLMATVKAGWDQAEPVKAA